MWALNPMRNVLKRKAEGNSAMAAEIGVTR